MASSRDGRRSWTLLEDMYLAGQRMHLGGAPAGAIGYAEKIAAGGDHAVAGDAPLQPQQRLERPGRQRLEVGALLVEMGGDDTPRGGVYAGVGVLVEPPAQLLVQVVEVAEAAGEKRVLTDVAERPLDLALTLGPVRPTSLRHEAVMVGAGQQGGV